MKNRLSVTGPVLSILVVMACLPASAGAEIYLWLGGEIKGEVQDDGHTDWIEIYSIHEDVSSSASSAIGDSRTSGTASFQDIVLTKPLDVSSPAIRQSLASGRHFNQVTIELEKPANDSRCVYLKYELEDVLITSVTLSGGSDNSVPTESLSLAFSKIKWIYSRSDNKFDCTPTSEAGWDLAANRPL